MRFSTLATGAGWLAAFRVGLIETTGLEEWRGQKYQASKISTPTARAKPAWVRSFMSPLSLPDDQIGFRSRDTFKSAWALVAGHSVANAQRAVFNRINALCFLACEGAFGSHHIDLLRIL